MPTGLKIPVGVNKAGGAAIESDESEQLKKLLILALSEGGDDNPFQVLGLPADLIFSIKDTAFRGRAAQAVNRVLQKFQETIRINPTKPVTFVEDSEGEVELQFEYIDLQTNQVKEFALSFTK